MSYQARRNDGSQREQNNQKNANNIRNAADIAIATKNPYAVAAGGAVKAADKLTGGKASDKLGKMVTKANQMAPGGKKAQDVLNNLDDSDLANKLGKAAAMYNAQNNISNLPEQNTNRKESSRRNKGDSLQNGEESNQDSESKGSGIGSVAQKVVLIGVGSLIIVIFFFVIIISAVVPYADFEDALGASYASGEETGSFTDFEAVTKEAKDFYERINSVKLEFAKEGKTIEAVRIVAVYHIMSSENNNFTYRNMTKSKIRQIADAMFEGNAYDEDTFVNNLANSIFKKYFPTYDDSKRMGMAKRVIKYIEDYYNFLGVDNSTCSEIGTCSYQIKGFYYPNSKGNYYLNPPLEFSSLKVRLMQTGFVNGHDYGGTFGKPLEGEVLIPFEEYVMGVAYFEIGDSSPDEAIKAALVAARSFALSRPFDMGSWRTLQKEQDGNWVLQLASSTADQGFCNPDFGCSSSNAQWGQIYSGHKYADWQKPALAQNSKLRRLASEVMGEVLVNEEGNIIYTGYNSTIHAKFIELANQGYDYKQILLSVYNNERPSLATGISKMSCTTVGSSTCNSTFSGPYTSWKQYEGPWANIEVGNSGKSIKAIGCVATSVAILIAKSGVPTTVELNPGSFVTTLNANGGFGTADCPGCILWQKASTVAPSFKYVDMINVKGYSREDKMNTLKSLLSRGYYVTAEVKGDTGSHWVAIDSINGNEITMIDPGSTGTNLWQTYPWYNTSRFVYYRVV